MNTTTKREARRATRCTPERIESAPRRGADDALFEVAHRGRQRAGAQRRARGRATSCGVKLPLIRPSSVIRPSMRGADCTRLSRMIASERPMFSPVTLPNLRAPVAVQREADGGTVVLVDATAWRCGGRAPVTAATFCTR